ncbi:MAG: hypothetical protein RL160_1739 [Bacteroidota bacterium]
MTYTLAILDDEPLSMEATKGIIGDFFKDILITGVFDNPVEALRVLSAQPCDILLSDIKMPGMNGFEFVQTLRNYQSPHVIFLTGYDEFAIQAIKTGAFDYFLKPISPQSLRESIQRLREKERRRSETIEHATNKAFDRLLINRNDKMVLLEFQDINRLYANGPYTHIYLTNDEQVVATKPLKYFEQALSGRGFIRPHRAHLFNVHNIAEVRKGSDGNGILVFKQGKEVFITQDCKNQLAKIIGLMQTINLSE